jgi:hypothetical protein
MAIEKDESAMAALSPAPFPQAGERECMEPLRDFRLNP